MKKFIGLLFMAIALLVLSATPVLGKQGQVKVTLPFEEEGTLGTADYVIKVPVDWNGKLVVDHRSAGGTAGVLPIPAETLLLAAGYALAASGYSVPLGDGLLKQGPKDTDKLVKYFKSRVGVPDRITLMGRSTGASFVVKLIEKHPQLYDGGLAASFGGAGFPRIFDSFIAVWLAYDVAFGSASGFRQSNPALDWGTPGDVRDDLTTGEVLDIVLPQLFNPANDGKVEFMRLVYGAGADWYLPSDGGAPPAELLFFVFLASLAQIETEAGGAITQNLDRTYTLTADEIAGLNGFPDIENAQFLLDEMNATEFKFEANKNARKYMSRHTDFSGRIKQPVLALNSKVDSIFRPENLSAYSERATEKGFGDNFVAAFVDQLGFDSQTNEQYFIAVLALDDWIETGIAPDPDEAGSIVFPEADGFINGFDPGPWPF